uniref:Uncharacterized protein n=1 Tax=Vombatus ursinus TaxID=29139 RepID=A0A4X2LSF8_VOMUR
MWRPYGHRPQYSNPCVQGEVMEGADNQGAREQGNPMRQKIYQGYRPQFCRGPPHQRQSRQGDTEDKENQGDGNGGQQPPQRWCLKCPGNPKPQDGKETKRAELPTENRSAPEAEQGGDE